MSVCVCVCEREREREREREIMQLLLKLDRDFSEREDLSPKYVVFPVEEVVITTWNLLFDTDQVALFGTYHFMVIWLE